MKYWLIIPHPARIFYYSQKSHHQVLFVWEFFLWHLQTLVHMRTINFCPRNNTSEPSCQWWSNLLFLFSWPTAFQKRGNWNLYFCTSFNSHKFVTLHSINTTQQQFSSLVICIFPYIGNIVLFFFSSFFSPFYTYTQLSSSSITTVCVVVVRALYNNDISQSAFRCFECNRRNDVLRFSSTTRFSHKSLCCVFVTHLH